MRALRKPARRSRSERRGRTSGPGTTVLRRRRARLPRAAMTGRCRKKPQGRGGDAGKMSIAATTTVQDDGRQGDDVEQASSIVAGREENAMGADGSRYREVYGAWKADPQRFWAEAARDIDWIRPADKVFDAEAGVYGRWFAGAECNTCHNAVD